MWMHMVKVYAIHENMVFMKAVTTFNYFLNEWKL